MSRKIDRPYSAPCRSARWPLSVTRTATFSVPVLRPLPLYCWHGNCAAALDAKVAVPAPLSQPPGPASRMAWAVAEKWYSGPPAPSRAGYFPPAMHSPQWQPMPHRGPPRTAGAAYPCRSQSLKIPTPQNRCMRTTLGPESAKSMRPPHTSGMQAPEGVDTRRGMARRGQAPRRAGPR